MTPSEAAKYKSSLDAFSHILKNAGPKLLFKGAGANIIHAVAGAGVLAGYYKLQLSLERNTDLVVLKFSVHVCAG